MVSISEVTCDLFNVKVYFDHIIIIIIIIII